ncbi:ScbA/BarX family gamma-butyrolactone biosynthesis protein [Streptomyces sp. NPDC006645]|uniref:ScbA/BarX family gamma-butyrolactone biosynthesis protein n=1 Tax=unclassified Streptomyces TaxID=2593676 RepID=UPI0033B7F5E4
MTKLASFTEEDSCTRLPLTPAKLGEFTHLSHADSILIKDARRNGADRFTLTVQWPSVGGPGRYDTRILAQTLRQTALFTAHAEYGVPTSHQTLLNRLDFDVIPTALDGGPQILDVDITVTKGHSRQPNALRINFRIHRDGVTVATAESDFSSISPGAYRRIRGGHATFDWASWAVPLPVPHEAVGRADAIEVSLSPGNRPGRWRLRNEPAHTLLFDHPVDHVPGLALLEAAQQAAHALLTPAGAPETTRARITYERYVEFDAPCWLNAEVVTTGDSDHTTIHVTGSQNNAPAFHVKLNGPPR